MANIAETERMVRRAKHEVEERREWLASAARDLAGVLITVAERLEREGSEADIDKEGVVRGRGAAIDVLCAQLYAARRTHGLIVEALKAATENP